MNTILFTVLALTLLGLVATAYACGWQRRKARDYSICLANIAEGTHAEGRITKKSDAAIATRYLVAKRGTDVNHADICGASDVPLGVFVDEADAAEDLVAIELFGLANRTLLMVASETMTFDDDVYVAASGKVQDQPTGAGTYYRIGKALTAGVANGLIEVQTCYPEKLVIVAAQTAIGAAALTGTLTGTANGSLADIAAAAGACAGGSTPSATQVDAAIATAVATIVSGTNEQHKELQTQLNLLVTDVTNLRTAINQLQAAPGFIKFL